MGAEPVRERVVEDGNIITGAGVTAGIDFALTLVARLISEDVAKNIQLGIEYDPDPPFNSGSIETADPDRVELQKERGADLAEKRRTAAERIGRERLGLKL
jgi:cyclohexyl-isocyanide hydratase